MDEMVTGSNQGTNVSQPIAAQAPESAPVQQEKVFKQSEVNDLVGRAKQEAIERYKRETSIASHQQPNYGQQSMQQSMQAGINTDDFRRMAAEEAQRLMDKRNEDAQRMAQEQEAQRIATEFFTKLSTGKEQFQDFDSVMGDMDFSKVANTVQLARGFDNVAAMMYHLRKNPTQLASLENLTYYNQKLAYEELQRLSQSIKDNDQAAKIKLPNEPLSQMRPSNSGTSSSEALTIRDLKHKYRG